MLCGQVLRKTWSGRILLISLVLLAVLPTAVIGLDTWGNLSIEDTGPWLLAAVVVIAAVIACSLAVVIVTLIRAVRQARDR